MEPTRNEMGDPFFRDLLRYGLHGSHTTGNSHPGEKQGRLFLPQMEPRRENYAVMDNVTTKSHETHIDNGLGGTMSRKYAYESQALLGQALVDRRNLARDRILRSGWASKIADLAIQYSQRLCWKELPSCMKAIQNFQRGYRALGEFCQDLGAIRGFLDGHIHKLIAFHALEKDFRIPDCIIRRADETTLDGQYKYAWFRSVLEEYKGLGNTGAAFWLIPYRGNGEGATAKGPDSGLARIDQVDEHTNTLLIEPPHALQEVNDHARGRKRARDNIDELPLDVPNTKVKIESIENVSVDWDRLPASQEDLREHGATSMTVAADANDGGEDKHQVGRRTTLTLLFHGMGMRREGAKDGESEHVQVYVPRTAKGVTINFL